MVCSERFAAASMAAVASGALQPVLDRIFPAAELETAHAYVLSNQQIGKVALDWS